MPDIHVIDIGQGEDLITEVLLPVYVFIADRDQAYDQAFYGRWAVVPPITDLSLELDELDEVLVMVGTEITDLDESGDSVRLLDPLAGSQQTAIADDGDSLDSLLAQVVNTMDLFLALDEGTGDDVVDLAFYFPVVEEALPGQVPGTVNLALNPGLDYVPVGTRGWSASGGGSVAADLLDPWSGPGGALLTVAAGTGIAELVVASQQGLAVADPRTWIGSAYVKGDARDIRPALRFHYLDATSELAFTRTRPYELYDLGMAAITGWWNALDMGAPADLSAVASWPGRDAAVRNLDQATGTAQPQYVADAGDGLPAVRFAGNDHMSRAGLLGNALSYAAVWKVGNPGSHEFLWNVSSTVRPKALKLNTGNYQFRANSGSTVAAMSHGVFHVTTGMYDTAVTSADEGLSMDGVFQSNGSLGSNGAGGTFRVGTDELATGSFLVGDVRQLILVSTVWTPATRQIVEAVLAWESGIVLPAGHPYELTPPEVVGGLPAPASYEQVTTDSAAHDPAKILDRIELVIQVPQREVAQTLRVDGAQIEEDRGHGRPIYADGDQGPGHRWTGAPGWSVSVRETA